MSQISSQKAAVLIVEDEPLILLDAVVVVEDAGFRAREAVSATDAIAILEQDSAIKAVFTDIQIMGEPDGLRLAHIVRERWPPVGLLVTSGRVLPAEHELPKGSRFLPKPYDPKGLVRALHSLMAA